VLSITSFGIYAFMALKKIFILTRYDALAASSRIRFFNLKKYFEQSGFKPIFKPLFSNRYAKNTAEKKYQYGPILKGFYKRLVFLLQLKPNALLFVEKEIFPWCPFILEKPFYLRHKIITDFDDAWHLRYLEIKNPFIKIVLGSKIFQVMKNCRLVVVGNPWLKNVAKKAGAQKIRIIPTNFEET